MEFYSWSDPLTIIVLVLGVILCCIFLKELYFYVRRKIPKRVKCWFCHSEVIIDYSLLNNWDCPKCEQYNGFTKDGDYNKSLEMQFDAKLNPFVFAAQKQKNECKTKNQLCDKCNYKQQLKMDQLASFVPMDEKNYDKEVEHFREQLEKGYKLCQDCDVLVSKVLYKLRHDLSLPKRLSVAISKIDFRGENAVYINVLLSIILAVSSISWKFEFPSELSHFLPESELIEYLAFIGRNVLHHPVTFGFLSYNVQFLIGTGILINSIGFYQTKSSSIFLNVISWILIFFLTLYPDGYEELINVLKIISSIISISISCILIYNNAEKRKNKKLSYWEKKKKMLKTPSTFGNTTMQPKYRFQTSPNTPYESRHANISKVSPRTSDDDSPKSISSGISNLSLGMRKRDLKRPPISKPVLTPPKFNPFLSSPKTSPSEKNAQLFGKPGFTPYSQYEPSLTPPSVFEGYDPTEPVTTIQSFSYPQQCYPCSPTLAYYFSSQQWPKFSPQEKFMTSVTPPKVAEKYNYFWVFICCLPVTFLVLCNLILFYIVYTNKVNVLKT